MRKIFSMISKTKEEEQYKMSKRKYYKKIIGLLLPYKKYIFMMSFMMLIITIGNVCVPLLQQNIVDDGLIGKDFRTLLTLVLIVVAISIITNLSVLFQSYLRIDLNATFLKDKQIEIFNHAFRLKMHYIKNDGLVQIIKDAEYSLNNISQITGNQMSDTFVQIFKFIGVFIGLIIINWKLTIFLLALIPIRLLITNKISKSVEKYQMDTILVQKEIHGWEDDIYHSAAEIKLWNLYDKKCSEYDKYLRKRNIAVKKMGFFAILSTLLGESIQTIFFNFLYVLGGILIWGNDLSLGGILAFVSYANYLMEPIGFVADLKIVLSEVFPAFDTYDQFINYEEEQSQLQLQERIDCTKIYDPIFKFENVTFSFKDRKILNNLTIDLNCGDKIAIIGENGSGKSTFINLLLRFYEIQDGIITLNSKSISEYELFSYRSLFSVIMQNPYLFRGTIMDNLTLFGKNKVGAELINNDLLDFVEKLPDKYNTDIGNNASRISGGEKQKIALFRALASNSKILVLDEPTAAYDKKSEKEFVRLLEKCNKQIIIMITHEPELLSFTNKIIEIKDGKIIQYKGYSEYLERKEKQGARKV